MKSQGNDPVLQTVALGGQWPTVDPDLVPNAVSIDLMPRLRESSLRT
jgi:hypothetical protein